MALCCMISGVMMSSVSVVAARVSGYIVQAMELLVAGVLQSAGAALSPGEALRRVMEAVAGGLLLDHGPGLRDPCEKELGDALGNLPPQKREDLTASAQQFLRQIAFRQIHKVRTYVFKVDLLL